MLLINGSFPQKPPIITIYLNLSHFQLCCASEADIKALCPFFLGLGWYNNPSLYPHPTT